MNIIPIDDRNSIFENVEIKDKTPHCKNHGAMNKMTVYEDGISGIWRCISTVSRNNDNNCRSGCQQINKTI